MKSKDVLKNISHKQLLQALFKTQLLFFTMAIFLSFILFDHIIDWFYLFSFDSNEIFLYGVVPGFIIILFNLLLRYFVPEHHLDDGGLNEKLFKNSNVREIFQIALVVAICEELLFRGLLQTVFGLVNASLIFALAHIRYLKKPVLLISVVLISFYFGFLYMKTNNLVVTMVAHFIVDFVLGILLRYEK